MWCVGSRFAIMPISKLISYRPCGNCHLLQAEGIRMCSTSKIRQFSPGCRRAILRRSGNLLWALSLVTVARVRTLLIGLLSGRPHPETDTAA
jgi:hypothetical protein